MQVIDPHVHLFHLQEGDYHWLKPENEPDWPDKAKIHQSFTESDLHLSTPLSLAGFVHIEAGFDNAKPWREIDWLESHCQLPLRTVGAIDLLSADFHSHIEALLQRRSVVGVRHILDGDAAAILRQPEVVERFKVLERQMLSFDAQLYLSDPDAVRALLDVMEQVPGLRIILNHGGLPPRWRTQKYDWFQAIQALSTHPQVAIKLSGWEMAKHDWKDEWFHWVLQDTMEAFGENRVMLASNFPLCTWTSSYQDLWTRYASNIPLYFGNRMFFHNAGHWYGF